MEYNRWYTILDNAPGCLPGLVCTPERKIEGQWEDCWYMTAPLYPPHHQVLLYEHEARPATDEEILTALNIGVGGDE